MTQSSATQPSQTLTLTDVRILDPETGRDDIGHILIDVSLITQQVETGVAMRMAVLHALAKGIT